MHILVIGATGFIGRHVVSCLLEKGHQVTAVARNPERLNEVPWKDSVKFISCNIHDPATDIDSFGQPDALIHLPWPGLPYYKSLLNIEETLPADYFFLKKFISMGIKHILVAGTCFEYGLQNGCLHEELTPNPVTSYGLAKDSLRRYLQGLQQVYSFTLQWARLFYMYGEGQHYNSLLPQLDRAIDNNDPIFNMSGGEQLRDYMPVVETAECLVKLIETPTFDGIVNVCSGKPISVRRLVEERIASRNASTKINRGYYPYLDYEPMAFWGDATKLSRILPKSNHL
jgi:dTDP-6-deoxy-L-talose 4-dehydrogenase (NAD+)